MHKNWEQESLFFISFTHAYGVVYKVLLQMRASLFETSSCDGNIARTGNVAE